MIKYATGYYCYCNNCHGEINRKDDCLELNFGQNPNHTSYLCIKCAQIIKQLLLERNK